ncbi:MAG: hypothetical protein WA821_12100, partial [Anaerolineales bacterium]
MDSDYYALSFRRQNWGVFPDLYAYLPHLHPFIYFSAYSISVVVEWLLGVVLLLAEVYCSFPVNPCLACHRQNWNEIPDVCLAYMLQFYGPHYLPDFLGTVTTVFCVVGCAGGGFCGNFIS